MGGRVAPDGPLRGAQLPLRIELGAILQSAHRRRIAPACAGGGVRLDGRRRDRCPDRPWDRRRGSMVPLFTPRFADLVSRRVGNYQANTYAAVTVLLDQLWIH